MTHHYDKRLTFHHTTQNHGYIHSEVHDLWQNLSQEFSHSKWDLDLHSLKKSIQNVIQYAKKVQ